MEMAMEVGVAQVGGAATMPGDKQPTMGSAKLAPKEGAGCGINVTVYTMLVE